ncbi:MAG: hypothetical protein AAFR37_14150, partial [Cyanobacteria bacterium J06628_3]
RYSTRKRSAFMEKGFFFFGDVYYLLPITHYPLPGVEGTPTNVPCPMPHAQFPIPNSQFQNNSQKSAKNLRVNRSN